MQKQRLIIKISGASLKKENNVFDYEQTNNIVSQIKQLSDKYEIVIILGGGNIFRGIYAEQFKINKNDADNIGMLSTAINGLMLESILRTQNTKAKVFNAFPIPNICLGFNHLHVDQALAKGYVCILTGGTGQSFFTTDTGVALRATQLGADFILMGKNGTDGVYDKDPNKHIDAQKFEKLTYDEILNLNLDVMDKTALTMCLQNNIKIIVFNIDKPNAIIEIMQDYSKGTIISK